MHGSSEKTWKSSARIIGEDLEEQCTDHRRIRGRAVHGPSQKTWKSSARIIGEDMESSARMIGEDVEEQCTDHWRRYGKQRADNRRRRGRAVRALKMRK